MPPKGRKAIKKAHIAKKKSSNASSPPKSNTKGRGKSVASKGSKLEKPGKQTRATKTNKKETQASSKPKTRRKSVKDSKMQDEAASPDYFTEENEEKASSKAVSSHDVESSAKVFEHAYEDPNWEGNENEEGSVASGILEEDFCQSCGLSTLSSEGWNSVILCDVCDAEFHVSCLKMDKPPRSTFVCYKCIDESEAMKNLRFNVSDVFRIPKRKVYDRTVIYTPSRPLKAAFQECADKGLMVVSEVFSYDVMRILTHGSLTNTTKSGRKADLWNGATVEIPQRLSAGACVDMIDRDGRFDLKLPDFVVQQLKLTELLSPILDKLRPIMCSEPQLRTHNIVFAPVGSKPQQWHTDDSAMKQRKPYRYFTILIHLNSLDSKCGGTEVWSDKLNRGDLIRARPGDALVFSGSLLHRGLGNSGYTHRFFYYASFACGVDMNVAI